MRLATRCFETVQHQVTLVHNRARPRMFVDTACSIMGEMLAMMFDMLAFNPSRLRRLLRLALVVTNPASTGGHNPFEIIQSPSNKYS